MPSHSDPREPGHNSDGALAICRHVLDRIGGRRQVPADVLRQLARDLNLPRERVQAALRKLVAAGELAYTFEHGRTFIEPSFDRSVRVSDRIVLAPPDRIVHPRPGDVVLRIMPGASFGAGRHPTTRLALKAIDFVLGGDGGSLAQAGRRVLDIGTGSGVLVMAAVKLGIETGWGVDIDPCAVSEAQRNVELNGLVNRIVVSERAAETVDGSYTLVTANLRTPTLERLAPRIAEYTAPAGVVVMSGIRTSERDSLRTAFEKRSFMFVWTEEEQEWAGLVMAKKT
jgi:ribosomal protein L11 methyltransferase